MSAVARDSPEMMGEAADTPRCPVLQRDWLGEGQRCSLTRHKSGRGGARPPLALPLQHGCREGDSMQPSLFKWTDGLLSPKVGKGVAEVDSVILFYLNVK